jgi:ribose 1,5-bisphosphokinase PhnN
MRLIYLVGQPGAGKSTLMWALTDGWRDATDKGPGGLWLRWLWTPTSGNELPDAAEIGRRRDAFSGTDALSMGVMPYAQAWIRATTVPLVLAEGDRLASMKFFDAACNAGREVIVVHVATTDAVAIERRRDRGSSQSERWVRGRCTKVARLVAAARSAGIQVVDVDGDAATSTQAAGLTSWL